VDLLRAAHKEGAFRVERDRQGVIRVFQGTAPSGLPSDPPAPILMDEVSDVPDVDVGLVPADLGAPQVADPTAGEPLEAVEAQTPAARSRRSRRPRATEATRTSRRKTGSSGKTG
jgi:hypothetical protein